MKQWKTPVIAVTCAATLLVGIGNAQTRQTDTTRRDLNRMATPSSPSMLLQRLSRIVGTNVEDSSGRKIGEIDNIALDSSKGEVCYVVLSHDNRLHPIPWQSFQFNNMDDRDARIVLNVDRDTLRSAPTIKRGEWRELSNQSFKTRVNQHFSVQTSATNGQSNFGYIPAPSPEPSQPLRRDRVETTTRIEERREFRDDRSEFRDDRSSLEREGSNDPRVTHQNEVGPGGYAGGAKLEPDVRRYDADVDVDVDVDRDRDIVIRDDRSFRTDTLNDKDRVMAEHRGLEGEVSVQDSRSDSRYIARADQPRPRTQDRTREAEVEVRDNTARTRVDVDRNRVEVETDREMRHRSDVEYRTERDRTHASGLENEGRNDPRVTHQSRTGPGGYAGGVFGNPEPRLREHRPARDTMVRSDTTRRTTTTTQTDLDRRRDVRTSDQMTRRSDRADDRSAVRTASASYGDIVMASDLLDANAQTMQREKVGDIEDILVSADGRVAFIVVSSGGLMGVRETYNAIPLQMVDLRSFRADQDTIVLNVERDRLREAPSFRSSEWQTITTDANWARDNFAYFGVQDDGSAYGYIAPPEVNIRDRSDTDRHRDMDRDEDSTRRPR